MTTNVTQFTVGFLRRLFAVTMNGMTSTRPTRADLTAVSVLGFAIGLALGAVFEIRFGLWSLIFPRNPCCAVDSSCDAWTGVQRPGHRILRTGEVLPTTVLSPKVETPPATRRRSQCHENSQWKLLKRCAAAIHGVSARGRARVVQSRCSVHRRSPRWLSTLKASTIMACENTSTCSEVAALGNSACPSRRPRPKALVRRFEPLDLNKRAVLSTTKHYGAVVLCTPLNALQKENLRFPEMSIFDA